MYASTPTSLTSTDLDALDASYVRRYQAAVDPSTPSFPERVKTALDALDGAAQVLAELDILFVPLNLRALDSDDSWDWQAEDPENIYDLHALMRERLAGFARLLGLMGVRLT